MLPEDIHQLIQSFDPISLLEMDRVKLMNRTDTKFCISMPELAASLPSLLSFYRILEIEDCRIPSYKSLYFDTESFKFYRDHHNQKCSRHKVRFRTYVESDLSFLEIKHKTKGRTNKRRIPVDQIPVSLEDSHSEFIRKVLPEKLDLIPVMWNAFHRITLVHKVANERLTLDFNLSFSWEGKEASFPNLVIAELKQEKVDRNSTFYSLMKSHIIRPYRLSKYCLGCIQLHGEKQIKYNRFKKKLLKLAKINPHAA
jgi:hypothetical protein